MSTHKAPLCLRPAGITPRAASVPGVNMAAVTILHQWPDGSVTRVKVEAATSYPDALAEAKVTAVSALAEVLAGFEAEEDR